MRKTNRAFTLLELLIVISIIAFIASASAPMIADFMRNRDLRGAGQIFQSSFVKARSAAISEKSEVRVVAFIDDNRVELKKKGFPTADIEVTGAIGSVHLYIFKNGAFSLHSEPKTIPDKTRFGFPLVTTEYVFHPSGVIHFPNDKDNDPEESFDTDIVIQQLGGSDKSCYIDIVRNTGRMAMSVR